MRLALVTQEEPFYLPPALDALCTAWSGDLVGLIVLPSFNEKLADTAKRLYEFYGPWDFLRMARRYATAKMADLANRRVRITRPYSALDVALRHRLPVYQPNKINSAEFIQVLQNQIRPDLIVSVAASQIFKKRLLDVPPLGCINLHSAPLPRYQGMMPNFWTLLHNEPEAAVTVHYMEEKIDAGDILLQKTVPIYPSDTLHELMVRSKQIGVQALIEAVEEIKKDTVLTKPMDPTEASYFSFPNRADALRLRAQGRRLL